MARHDPILGRLRLRQLQCFLTVVRHGHLGNAAEALAISQPAVTKTLNELEETLGVKLLDRGRHGAKLTPEGAIFLRHAEASTGALQLAIDALGRADEDAPLLLGALPTLASTFVARLLAGLRAERPHATVRVITDANDALLDRLRRRELDVVIGRLADPARMFGLIFEPLFAENMLLVAAPGHPVLTTLAADPASLGEHPLVLAPPDTLLRHSADSFFARLGVTPAGGLVETLADSLALALVRDAGHLWFTASSAARRAIELGEAVALPFAIPSKEPVGLLLRTEGPTSPAVQALVGVARAG
ncbi:LysR substrate-binding domain-containing protein [Derxia lacustris]|uniref:LysR substrate-binding domain-containing protein n=1 Tax=Derxia lacustris TaxID=764842 RepID=UPI00159453AF|nr:LysR substrate-binding domain-containing protein [Derxia lacustris]